MTKYVEELTKDIMGILEKNCGRHYNKKCKNSDMRVILAVQEEVRKVIHSNLNNMFMFLTESAAIRARKQELERNTNE
tara:strand:+ start:445 stop:678 length:234 start_codon:yes stop_codon:yes gene_type:complete